MIGWRLSITYGGRRFIILVNCVVNANPERNKYTSEANKAESNAPCFGPYPPQCCNERVDSKYLVWCSMVCTVANEF
jgi:hypothetical protein